MLPWFIPSRTPQHSRYIARALPWQIDASEEDSDAPKARVVTPLARADCRTNLLNKSYLQMVHICRLARWYHSLSTRKTYHPWHRNCPNLIGNERRYISVQKGKALLRAREKKLLHHHITPPCNVVSPRKQQKPGTRADKILELRFSECQTMSLSQSFLTSSCSGSA